MITCHLTTYRASRNRFSAINFHDYLHYCAIFLARFSIKIVLNIISCLHIVFSLCVWVGFLWCLYRCYQLNKSRCRRKWDVTIEYLTRAILDKQLTALHVVHHLFKRYVFFSRLKCGPRPKLFLRLDIFSMWVDHIILAYLGKSFILDYRIK